MNKNSNDFLIKDFSLNIGQDLQKKLKREYKKSIQKIKLKNNYLFNNSIYFNKCMHIREKPSQF